MYMQCFPLFRIVSFLHHTSAITMEEVWCGDEATGHDVGFSSRSCVYAMPDHLSMHCPDLNQCDQPLDHIVNECNVK